MSSKLLRLIVGCVLATIWLSAQGQPAFEVATIKRNVTGSGASLFRFEPDGSVRVANKSLRDVVRLAYSLDAYQVVDWPRWMADERYDILATPKGTLSAPERIEMLRTLLADRCKLATHTETRDGLGYALVVAQGEHPHLRPSDRDCVSRECGLRVFPGRFVGDGVPIMLLARTLAMGLERLVVDETMLTGAFSFDLTFAPNSLATSVQGAAGVPPPDTNAPSIFTALREQLGLALEAVRRPLDVYIIDHVERPTED